MNMENIKFENNIFDISEYLNLEKTKSVIKYFFGIMDLKWIDDINKNFVKSNNNENIYGSVALYYYLIVRHIIDNRLAPINSQGLSDYMGFLERLTSIYLSPFASISKDVKLVGTNINIYGDYKICEESRIFSNVNIGDRHYDDNVLNVVDNDNNILLNDTKSYVIDKKCILENNATIKFCSLGQNVKVNESCVLRENIVSDSVVDIVNQLQIVSTPKSYIPSQTLSVYGLVPKYKNTLTIFGEGIYNPNVIIRDNDKKVSSQIEYWDKNKIIVKIKGYLLDRSDEKLTENEQFDKKEEMQEIIVRSKNDNKSIIVIMSRGIKVTINDYVAVKKLLKNI